MKKQTLLTLFFSAFLCCCISITGYAQSDNSGTGGCASYAGAGGTLDNTGNDLICPNDTNMSPVVTPPSGPADAEYIVTDGSGGEILASSTSSTFTPAALGLGSGDQMCVTAVAYDLQVLQNTIDNILNNCALVIIVCAQTCCTAVSNAIADANPDFTGNVCDLLSDAGINSGSDIQGLDDIVTVASILSPGNPITLAGITGLIDDTINPNSSGAGANCFDGNICYAYSNEVCYTIGTEDCAGVCDGTAVEDCNGVCNGTSTLDCAGVCDGTAVTDVNGTCCQPGDIDCAGVCFGTSVVDCDGVCGGTATEDCAGVCNGTSTLDCAGVCDGTAVTDVDGACCQPADLDCAGVCNGTSVVDCAGVCGGTSVVDNCGVCLEPTDPAFNDCVDCAGVPSGTAVTDVNGDCCQPADLDCAGVCNGTAMMDCAGNCGGSAVVDACGACLEPSDPDFDNCVDCEGTVNGTAVEDPDGTCCQPADLDCAGFCNGTALVDCAGTCNGTALIDDCGTCLEPSDPLFNNCVDCEGTVNGTAVTDPDGTCCQPADLDCAGFCNGTATEDCAGVCNGTSMMDCAGVCNGSSVIDNCGVCLEPSDPLFNDCEDCAGVPSGTSVTDPDGVCCLPADLDCAGFCNGTATEDCAGVCNGTSMMDCAGVCDGSSVIDNCGVCLEPSDPAFNDCVDCAGVPNGTFMMDDCGQCLDPSDSAFNTSCADCLGVPNGTDLPGTPCDDGDPVTVGDEWNADCECIGGAIPGCTDMDACNFDPMATLDDGSCLENDCEGICGGPAVPGTTCDDGDPTTLNEMWDNDCNCTATEVSGCSDATADNFDPAATVDDGSCIYSGCTDPAAANYNAMATVDDGSCILAPCLLDGSFEAVNNGSSGSFSPFYYNQIEITITGFTGTLDWEWDTEGYVRHSINPDGTASVITADNATFSVTVTDEDGCVWILSEDDFGTTTENPTLDISDSDVTSTGVNTDDGSVNITVEGGTGPYTYDWTGPSGFTATTQDIYNLDTGWYSVVVTDANGAITEGWYWIPLDRNSGRLKAGEINAYINAYPNPFFGLTNIEFVVSEDTQVALEVFDTSGKKVADLFNAPVSNGLLQSIAFDASQLNAGVYIVKLSAGNSVNTHKLVIME